MLISVFFLKLTEIYIDNSPINAYMNHITVNILIQQCRNIIHTVKIKKMPQWQKLFNCFPREGFKDD